MSSVTIDVEYITHTDLAVLVEEDIWIPRSLIEEDYDMDWDILERHESIEITIPEWKAEQEGLA
jgi:hypothetical protein